jgi:hypothetical protein
MIRTIWLVLGCVLGGLAVGRASFTTPVALTELPPTNDAAVGNDFTQVTLAKGDRLPITYVPQESSTELSIPPAPTIVSPAETKIVSRHWRDPNAPASTGAKSNKKTAATEKKKP